MNESKSKLNTLIIQKIQELRKKQGLSQDQLALKAGLEIKYVNKIENSKVVITIVTLDKIIKALSTNYNDFFAQLDANEGLSNDPYEMISSLQVQLEKINKELDRLKGQI